MSLMKSIRKASRLTWILLMLAAILAGCQAPLPATYPPSPTATGAGITSLNTGGPAISSLLVGNNVWMYPDTRVWDVSAKAGLKIMRIGGIAFDQAMPSNELLRSWVDNIKKLGAEPMIQVSRSGGAEAAAAVVRYFNEEIKNPVRYWNIGNEPYCNKATDSTAAEVAGYIRPIAAAMKAVDPTIQIFAPDECYIEAYYDELLSGDNGLADISGKVPGQDYYYIDGVSWHLYTGYPPENIEIEHLATQGAAAFLDQIRTARALVDRANEAQRRTGEVALQWGIGEFNSSDGPRVCSFENGQMFAQVYGYIMKYGGTYGETWSMLENGARCLGTDYSFVNADMTPRPTFYHMQLISDNFSGNYLDGTSSVEAVRAFGAVDEQSGRIAVMLLNVEAASGFDCTLRLDDVSGTSECQVNVPAGLPVEMRQAIGSQTTRVLVFDLQGKLVKTITYAKTDASPITTALP
jgi:hypothetical protein